MKEYKLQRLHTLQSFKLMTTMQSVIGVIALGTPIYVHF